MVTTFTVAQVGDLTPALLSQIVGAEVATVTAKPLATGNMNASSRLHLTYVDGANGPASLVAKMPVDDPVARLVSAVTDRTEIGFYTEVASQVAVPSARCYNGGISEEHGALIVLEDITPATMVDQIDGCYPEQALLAITNVAGLHGPTWNDPTFRDLEYRAPIGPHMAEGMHAAMAAVGPTFIERYSTPDDEAEVIRAFAAVTKEWYFAREEPYALRHNDYRLDNMLFRDDGSVVTVDWGTISSGLAIGDVSYFIATGLETDLRREHERRLVAAYCDALAAHGITYAVDDAWNDYVYSLFHAVLITVMGAANSRQSERGDRMFRTMMRRSCAAIRDHDALSLLP